MFYKRPRKKDKNKHMLRATGSRVIFSGYRLLTVEVQPDLPCLFQRYGKPKESPHLSVYKLIFLKKIKKY